MTFHSAPLWALGLVVFLLLLGFSLAGVWLRQRRRATREDSGSEGHLLSATLALLGLLCASAAHAAPAVADAAPTPHA